MLELTVPTPHSVTDSSTGKNIKIDGSFYAIINLGPRSSLKTNWKFHVPYCSITTNMPPTKSYI